MSTLTPEQRIAELEEKLALLLEVKAAEAPTAMPPGNWGTPDAFAAALATAMQTVAGPKKVTFGEYARRPSIGHPLGPKGPKLLRDCYHNGFRIEYATSTDEQIELLNKIDRAGRYFDRKVEIVFREDDNTIDIRWACATADQRFGMTRYFHSLEDMLAKIVAVNEAEDAAEFEAPPVKRPFGNTKAYREAVAKRAEREAAAAARP
jgi:hypothetical protein